EFREVWQTERPRRVVRQTARVGIVLAVLFGPLFNERCRPRLKRQTALDIRADVQRLRRAANLAAALDELAHLLRAGNLLRRQPDTGEVWLAVRQFRRRRLHVRLAVWQTRDIRRRVMEPLALKRGRKGHGEDEREEKTRHAADDTPGDRG